MFEKVVLRRSATGQSLTLGEIAEGLLFYQNVHLVIDYGTLYGLLESLGPDQLLSLLARPNITAVYCEEILCTVTNKFGVSDAHNFSAVTITGDQQGQQKTPRERIEKVLLRLGKNKNTARKFTDRFLKKVPIRTLTNSYYLPGGIERAATLDLHDPTFVHEAVRRIVENTVGAPEILGDFKFEVLHANEKFFLFSDLDIDRINVIRQTLKPPPGDLSLAHFANEILMARADMALAAHYGGEFYTSDTTSQIVRLRHSDLLRRVGISTEELKQLHEIVLPNSPTIREVIDSGERTFDEFLHLLDKSQRFRDWIQQIHPDEKIVIEYLGGVTAEGWAQKLPSKTLRYLLGAVIGDANAAIGLALSAVDSFFLDKMTSGWRPSHFVEQRLKPFLKQKE